LGKFGGAVQRKNVRHKHIHNDLIIMENDVEWAIIEYALSSAGYTGSRQRVRGSILKDGAESIGTGRFSTIMTNIMFGIYLIHNSTATSAKVYPNCPTNFHQSKLRWGCWRVPDIFRLSNTCIKYRLKLQNI
jgi:hypothetical protein